MKKLKAVALVLSVMFVLSSSAFAEEVEQNVKVGKSVNFAIGYKAWYNTWQSANGTYPPEAGSNVQAYTSDPALAHIFLVSLKIKKFFISESFLLSPEYDFPTYTDTLNVGGTPVTATYKNRAKRRESDVNIGYYIVPNLAVTAGYKNVWQEITQDVTFTGGFPSQTNLNEPEYYGPTLGIAGSVPVGGGFGLYGSGAGGWMKMKYKGGSATYDAPYAASELGFTYTPKRTRLSLLLGYKFQTIEQKLPSYDVGGSGEPKSPDVTKGFVFGLNLVF